MLINQIIFYRIEIMNRLREKFERLQITQNSGGLQDITNTKQESYKVTREEDRKKTEVKRVERTSLVFKKERKSLLPYQHLVSSDVPTGTFKKFISLAYRGATYSLKFLKGPSEKFLESKKVVLEQPKNSKKKFLLLDLDETLIHTVGDKQPAEVNLKIEGSDDSFNFNVRPHCYDFLKQMSEHYTIYVFTASTYGYAKPIIQYLNRNTKTIHDFLCRTNCMETKNGFFIKDLRIVSNRSLKDIILVDNLVHSFGLQIQNGIPILEYKNNDKDRQLLYVGELLMELKDEADVRVGIQEKLNLRGLIEVQERLFE